MQRARARAREMRSGKSLPTLSRRGRRRRRRKVFTARWTWSHSGTLMRVLDTRWYSGEGA